jgi:2',3'-cyclic-nucleotide 2'-phosphodiesterase (5'-nucleotidase family)
VAIVQAGSYARFVGRVEVEFAEQTTISGKLLLLV